MGKWTLKSFKMEFTANDVCKSSFTADKSSFAMCTPRRKEAEFAAIKHFVGIKKTF